MKLCCDYGIEEDFTVSDKLRASRLPVKNQRVSVEPEPDLADKGEKAAFRVLLKDIYCNPVIKTPLTETVIQRKCCKSIFILKANVYSVMLKANWSLKFNRFRLDNLFAVNLSECL